MKLPRNTEKQAVGTLTSALPEKAPLPPPSPSPFEKQWYQHPIQKNSRFSMQLEIQCCKPVLKLVSQHKKWLVTSIKFSHLPSGF